MVKVEYLVMVGDLFVSNFFGNVGSVHFTDRQNEAERYSEEKLMKVVSWLDEHHVKYDVYQSEVTTTKLVDLPKPTELEEVV